MTHQDVVDDEANREWHNSRQSHHPQETFEGRLA